MSSYKTPKPDSPFYLPPEIYRNAVTYCRCYKRWKTAQIATTVMKGVSYDGMPHGSGVGNPTEAAVLNAYKNYAPQKAKVIEDTVREVDERLYKWLLVGVTENVNYNYLKLRLGMPCGKNAYFRKRQEVYYRIANRI